MNKMLVGFLGLVLVLPVSLGAEVVLRPHDPAAAARPRAAADPERDTVLRPKIDQPQDFLVVPFYEVDTLTPFGDTTLFAVRNTANSGIDIRVEYRGIGSNLQRQDLLSLDPRETLTVNVRDVAGLDVGPDGYARGYIRIFVTSAVGFDNLTGDFFSVDVDGAFASGERLLGPFDVCDLYEIRFIDFGSPAELYLLIALPQGADPESDPPSVTVRPITENGGLLAPTDVFTDQTLVKLPATAFTGVDFGTLTFDFAVGGYVFGKYSSQGKFSVGLNGACIGTTVGP
jgi:hypothetical protein